MRLFLCTGRDIGLIEKLMKNTHKYRHILFCILCSMISWKLEFVYTMLKDNVKWTKLHYDQCPFSNDSPTRGLRSSLIYIYCFFLILLSFFHVLLSLNFLFYSFCVSLLNAHVYVHLWKHLRRRTDPSPRNEQSISKQENDSSALLNDFIFGYLYIHVYIFSLHI